MRLLFLVSMWLLFPWLLSAFLSPVISSSGQLAYPSCLAIVGQTVMGCIYVCVLLSICPHVLTVTSPLW